MHAPPAEFDFTQIAVPFRMQPGLQRLAGDTRHLTPLVEGTPLWQEKQRVWASGRSRLVVPGFNEQPVLDAIRARARVEGLLAEEPLELAFEQDFAVLEAGGTLPWLCVCVPSHWAPEDKLGSTLHSVHAPVADGQALRAAAPQLAHLVTAGGAWERWVWTITPDGRFDQHPHRHTRLPWPDTASPSEFALQCWLRAERQTFFPVAAAAQPQAVFTIHVRLQPLADAICTPAEAVRLHAAVGSMTDAVLAYKSLTPARDRLLAWLLERGR